MGRKEKLACEYVILRSEFDGANFKPSIKELQIEYLIKEFKIVDLEDKINAVKNAIKERNKRLNKL